MKVQQDEITPHHASIGPVVETKPTKWGWIESKNEFGFTPEGNMSLKWIGIQIHQQLEEELNKLPPIRKGIFPEWWYDDFKFRG